MKTIPECHPDRPIYAKKMCKACYMKEFRGNRTKPSECHPELINYALGMCGPCYRKRARALNGDRIRARQREAHRKWLSNPKNKEKVAANYQKNRARRDAQARAWALKNPHRAHEIHIKAMYGLLPEQYKAMLADQNGVCAICKGGFEAHRFKRPCVDHDHGTGKVRGLLCDLCNKMLGHSKDRPEVLQAASLYLKKAQEL